MSDDPFLRLNRQLQDKDDTKLHELLQLGKVVSQQSDPPPQRFFIGSDDSGHDYLVPVDRRDEWFAWCEIPSDDERSWEVPEYATAFETTQLSFTDPEFE